MAACPGYKSFICSLNREIRCCFHMAWQSFGVCLSDFVSKSVLMTSGWRKLRCKLQISVVELGKRREEGRKRKRDIRMWGCAVCSMCCLCRWRPVRRYWDLMTRGQQTGSSLRLSTVYHPLRSVCLRVSVPSASHWLLMLVGLLQHSRWSVLTSHAAIAMLCKNVIEVAKDGRCHFVLLVPSESHTMLRGNAETVHSQLTLSPLGSQQCSEVMLQQEHRTGSLVDYTKRL